MQIKLYFFTEKCARACICQKFLLPLRRFWRKAENNSNKQHIDTVMRKIYTILLLALCAMAANAASYDIKIAGITVTDANKANVMGDGKVSYNPSTNTVTLDGASIDLSDGNFAIDCNYSKKLTIVLKSNSNNFISVGGLSNSNDAVIQSMGPITITSEENPGYVAKLRIITYGTPELYTYNGDIRIEGPIEVTLSGTGGNDSGNMYNTFGGKLYIDGATVNMTPCRIRMDGTTITRSKITKPTDAVVAADGKIIRDGTTTEYGTTQMVTVSSQLHKLYIGPNPQNTGNYVQHGEEEQPSARRYYEWFEIGQTLKLIATEATGYELYAWYSVAGEDTKLIGDENPLEYIVNSTDDIVYAQFEKKTDFVLNVDPKNAGNLALCNDQPTDGSKTFQYTTATILELKAIPSYGYKFVGWYSNDASTPYATTPSVSALKGEGNETMVAKFEKDASVVDKVLTGAFEVANNKYVRFSPGNLQYQPFTHLFRFAADQNEAIRGGNMMINDNSIDWFDLFGWGTGDEPARTSTNNADYATWTEWGTNPVVNGGNQADQWRTLTNSEWIHIFAGRPNADQKWGVGMVNGVQGMILLPDNFPITLPHPKNSNFNDNNYADSEWNWMESHGAVFLPLTGYRSGTSMQQTSTQGWYWSATPYSETMANHIKIASNGINYSTASKYTGQAVRLVQNIDAPTGLEEVSEEPRVESRKMIRDGQLLIIRDGKIFNAYGVVME